MKLLVTGGSGFLGRRTAAYFEQMGWQVFTPSHGELDITESTALRSWFRLHNPQAVIHTAAVSDTGLCQRRPEWSEEINVTGCVNLAECCQDVGARLVICSSDQIYFGSPVSGPHRENEEVTPCNIYGAQKLRAEQRCMEILPETVCLRLSWMYAKDSYPGEHGHFLVALKAALEDATKPLTWPIYDRRGLTDVETVVKNLQGALQLPGGVWNFGAENDCSTYETVRDLLETAGMKAALERLTPNKEAFAENPRDISMDLSKLNAAGIFFPNTKEGLYQALRETV